MNGQNKNQIVMFNIKMYSTVDLFKKIIVLEKSRIETPRKKSIIPVYQ